MHSVPLGHRASEILDEMRAIRQGDFIFNGARPGRPLGDVALFHVLKAMNWGAVTAHGMRSSFRDWAAERTDFPNEVCEMALAHRVADAVERAYRRGSLLQKRRALMAEWDRFCTTPDAQSTAEILEFARG
jgi:integrase